MQLYSSIVASGAGVVVGALVPGPGWVAAAGCFTNLVALSTSIGAAFVNAEAVKAAKKRI